MKYNEVALFIQVNRVFKKCFVEVTLAAKKLFRGADELYCRWKAV